VLPLSAHILFSSGFPFEVASGSYLKKRILVQDQGGRNFQTGGILLYFEDLK